MPIVTTDTLKGYFNNAAVPNHDNYVDVIDTLSNNPGSIIPIYQSLSGLRGFWPMSSMNEVPVVIDLSGQGRNLSKSGSSATLAMSDTVTLGLSYALYSASNYLYRADEAGLDIIGNEASIHSSYRGLTCGAWIRATATPTADAGILSKYLTTGNQRSYMLYRRYSNSRFTFLVSTDGINGISVESSQSIVLNSWNFIVGRFDPSTELAIFHNGYWVKNTTSIPATLFSSTARLELGAYDAGNSATTWSHQGAFYFLTATTILDSIIERIFDQTKHLFGY